MKRYRAMIFDFDMTLADTSTLIMGFLNEIAQKFGYSGMSYEQALPIVGNTHERMLAYVTGEKDPEKVMVMREAYRELIGREMASRTVLFPDAPSCLRLIHEKGIRLGLLSQKLHKVLEDSLEVNGLSGIFDVITGVEDQPIPKPDPSGLILTMDKIGVSPEETLYIGDSLIDQEAAADAGVDFAAMLKGGTLREQFDPDKVLLFYLSPAELEDDIRRM